MFLRVLHLAKLGYTPLVVAVVETPVEQGLKTVADLLGQLKGVPMAVVLTEVQPDLLSLGVACLVS
jgi:hypothetical protein